MKPISEGGLVSAVRRRCADGLDLARREGPGALLFKIKEARNRSVWASGIPLVETGEGSRERLSVREKLSGKFRFPASRLDRVDVLTARDRAGARGISLSIADGEGKILRKAIVLGRRVRDEGFTTFRFSPIEDSMGRTFTYIIEPYQGDHCTVMYSPAAETGRGKISCDGAGYDGSACFNAYARLGRKRAYDVWMMKNEPDRASLQRYRDESGGFAFRPLISIITPVYNPDPGWIKAAVESVTGQAYTNWELCITDASTREDVKQLLREFAAKDSRIRLVFAENLGISGNSNLALAQATGDYVAFLDHDDELAPDALYEVARLLQADPGADIIYSDEDFISPCGERVFPSFKPEWSPDLLLSGMYICHLCVYRKSLVDQSGPLRKEYDGAQDYDLALRCIEKARAIRHIPRVLYHFRQSAGSTSFALGNKEYADIAARQALGDYMRRNGIAGEATTGLWPGSYRVRRALEKKLETSVIVYATDPVRAAKCVESVLRTAEALEVLLIDDSPRGEVAGKIGGAGYGDRVALVRSEDRPGRPALCNRAAGRARGDVLLFFDSDLEGAGDAWLGPMLEHVQREEVGAVGCKLLYPDGSVMHAGIVIGMDHDGVRGIAGYPHRYYPGQQHGYCGRIGMIQNFSAVSGDCLMIRRALFERAGGFDESLRTAYHDVDLCLRLRQADYRVVYTPFAVLRRHRSPAGRAGGPGAGPAAEDAGTIRRRWGELLRTGDPYFSPNLDPGREDMRIRL